MEITTCVDNITYGKLKSKCKRMVNADTLQSCRCIIKNSALMKGLDCVNIDIVQLTNRSKN